MPGATYFFTVTLRDRTSDILIRHIEDLRASLRTTMAMRPFQIDAWVVLPDHMHCLWTLPAGDVAYPERWKSIKFGFSRAIPCDETRTPGAVRRRERAIWQPRYWEHTIRDDGDYAAHFDYIHFNPVKHGHVQRPADWEFSSFHRAVKAGLYPSNWSKPNDDPPETGEPP